MKKKAILTFIVKVLKAVLYVLSAGHLCSCKDKCEPEGNGEADK